VDNGAGLSDGPQIVVAMDTTTKIGPGRPVVRQPVPAKTPMARLSILAADRSGLFTRDQARACGFSAYQIRRRVRDGEWRWVLGPVLSAAGLRPTPHLRDAAAQLAIGGSVLAGPSAARRHGIVVRDPHCYLATGPGERGRLPGVRLLRDTLLPTDIVIVDGVLVTDRARTVFDCLRVLPDPDAVDLLGRALPAGWISAPELAERVHLFAGRRGAKRLAGLSRIAASETRPAAARMGADLLHRGGFTAWRANVEIHDDQGPIGVADIVFEIARVVVEFDARALPVTPDRFERDRERHNRLVAAGWVVLRFTRRDLTQRPEYVIATLRTMLARPTS
jgi:hypothetical protein